ncbi:MAG: acetylxylan esterase, partial [Planctomycetes bacterium]|nr:acetylxylan esterase [Planctomycetota bacterium]
MTKYVMWSVPCLFICVASALAAEPASQPADVRLGPLPNTNTVFTPAHYGRAAEWQRHRDWLRDQVRLAAGLIPEPPLTSLNPRIFGKLVRDGYTIEKVYFSSSPGIYVTGNLYRPLHAEGKCPGVACPHGHWKNGRLHHDETGSIPARCITLARHGAVVFAYDMVGYNDGAMKFKHSAPELDTRQTALWGIGHLQLQTWNSVRVIDFLQSLPDVDPKRIGVTGASGGGTQTFILAAVDDRVTVACPVNMISSTMQGGCICENAPCLRIDTNNMEIGALFAPKPMLMVSATGDWTKLTPTVEYPFIRGIYELYGRADHVANVHIDAPHNYNRQSREVMYQFFGQWLGLGPAPSTVGPASGGVGPASSRSESGVGLASSQSEIHEGDIPVEKPEDMLVFSNPADVPADMPTAEQVVERKKAEFRQLLKGYRPNSRRGGSPVAGLDLGHLGRVFRQHAIGYPDVHTDTPKNSCRVEQDERKQIRYRGALGWQGRLVPILGLIPSRDAGPGCVIVVDPDGIGAVDKHRQFVERLLGAGRRVVFVEPFSTGSHKRPATQPADGQRFFPTFNRTDAAEAVYDLLTVFAA